MGLEAEIACVPVRGVANGRPYLRVRFPFKPSHSKGKGDFLTAMTDPIGLGVEIGGTKLQLGLGRGDGTLIAIERARVKLADGAQGILADIQAAFHRLRAQAGIGLEQIEGAGIGFGGPVDTVRGRVVKSHQVAGWEDFALGDWVRSNLGIARVAVQNDADTAGLGEARFGAGIGYSPLLYVTIGSGIGGGLILDGQIYRGAGAGALEIGHLWVVGRTTSDLGVVKLEDLASGWAIASAARRQADAIRRRPGSGSGSGWSVLDLAGGDPARIQTEMVATAARQGDQEALLLLQRATMAMSHALVQTITLVAPERIILGGGVSEIDSSLWLDPIRQQVDRLVFPPFRGSFEIVPARLGEEVVVHGALALAHDLANIPKTEPPRSHFEP